MKDNNAYKTISETSKILDIPSHVLRFWEKKFTNLKPKKSIGGRRYYSPTDFQILNSIKNLLYNKGYTINGAISYLENKENNDNSEKELKKDNKDALTKLDSILTSVDKIKKIIENY